MPATAAADDDDEDDNDDAGTVAGDKADKTARPKGARAWYATNTANTAPQKSQSHDDDDDVSTIFRVSVRARKQRERSINTCRQYFCHEKKR